MFKNYLKIALRNFQRHRAFSFINISGLAIGIAYSIFIFIYVWDELSYDKFHSKADQIYRLSGPIKQGLLGPLLQRELPEVKSFVRIYANKVWGRNTLVSYQDNHFFTDGFFLVDPSFLEIFSFPLMIGDPNTALSELNNVVLTEEAAKKFFGDEDPMGKIITHDEKLQLKVTGVAKNIPYNSHIHFDFLAPLDNYKIIRSSPNAMENWGNSAFLTYLLVQKGTNKQELEGKIATVIQNHAPDYLKNMNLVLQPITDIHLRSHSFDELEINGDIKYVYIFSTIALLILFIACMNYMNLTTARSLNRAKEVGMRKVVGAKRVQLIKQFLSEAILMSLFALLIAIILVYLFMPLFKHLAGKELTFNPMKNMATFFFLFILSLFIGLLAGSFPAFFLSGFQPINIITGKLKLKNLTTAIFRKSLVIIQFVISISLIACTVVIKDQMDFIRNKKLGFEKQKIVVFPTMRNEEAISRVETIMNEFARNSAITDIAASSHTPGNRPFYRGLWFPSRSEDQFINILSLWTNQDFASTYQLEFLAGRDFSKEMSTDATSAFILNETAVKMCNWNSPKEAIGKLVRCDEKTGKIIGVVKDFHFLSLHSEIEPMIMHYDKKRFYSISARVNTDNIAATLTTLKKQWKQLLPDVPCNYFFLDEQYDQQYRADQKVGSFLKHFTFLAIFISCLGLFGLASFTAEQRTKELGIRKVLGASVPGIVLLLSRDFTKWVLVANIFALPITWYIMNKWLQIFAYRTNIAWTTFIISAGIALLISLVTVSYQSVKAALANPVERLRYE